jgi:hypothetical protein
MDTINKFRSFHLSIPLTNDYKLKYFYNKEFLKILTALGIS